MLNTLNNISQAQYDRLIYAHALRYLDNNFTITTMDLIINCGIAYKTANGIINRFVDAGYIAKNDLNYYVKIKPINAYLLLQANKLLGVTQ